MSTALSFPNVDDVAAARDFATHAAAVSERAAHAHETLMEARRALEAAGTAIAIDELRVRTGVVAGHAYRAATTLHEWAQAAWSYAAHLEQLMARAHTLLDERARVLATMRAIESEPIVSAPVQRDALTFVHLTERLAELTERLTCILDEYHDAACGFALVLASGREDASGVPASLVESLGMQSGPLSAAAVERFLAGTLVDSPRGAAGYGYVDLPLFLYGSDGDPVINSAQVSQGRLGDCWFIATLMAVADMRPDLIEQMISYDAASGMYTVRLHDVAGEPSVVQVDGRVLLDTDGKTFGAGRPEDKVLWPAIIEKALAQTWGGYAAIEGDDPAKAIHILMGAGDVSEATYGEGSPGLLTLGDRGAPVLAAALANGGIAVAYTRGAGDLSRHADVVGNHAYYVTRVDGDLITLQNPWGTDDEPPVSLSWDQFTRDFRGARWTEG